MSLIAHVGGVPVEELLPPFLTAGGAAGLLVVRSWVGLRLRRRRGSRR